MQYCECTQIDLATIILETPKFFSQHMTLQFATMSCSIRA